MKYIDQPELAAVKAGRILVSLLALLSMCALVAAVGLYVWASFQSREASWIEGPAAPSWSDMRESLLGVSASGSEPEVAARGKLAEERPFASEFAEIMSQFDSLYGLAGREESPFSEVYPPSVVRQFLLENPNIPDAVHSHAVEGLRTLAHEMAGDSRLARIHDAEARTNIIAAVVLEYANRYATELEQSQAYWEKEQAKAVASSAERTRGAIEFGAAAAALSLGSLLVLVLLRIEVLLRNQVRRSGGLVEAKKRF